MKKIFADEFGGNTEKTQEKQSSKKSVKGAWHRDLQWSSKMILRVMDVRYEAVMFRLT
jgi:hypothetical protein